MRHRRAKAYKKLMSLYQLSFGFREPYQVLVDSGLCSVSISLKLDLVKHFSTVLQGKIKPMITQCSIVELYKLGPTEQQAVDLAKSFERRKCNHREAISGDECLFSVVGDTNKHRYVVASQSQPLRTQLRNVPGVPMVHLNRSVMVLEPPSIATLSVKREAEEKALLPLAVECSEAVDNIEQALKKRPKGPKGPNPLSVKKKKVKTGEGALTTTGTKRKREDESTMLESTEGRLKRKRRKKGFASSREPE